MARRCLRTQSATDTTTTTQMLAFAMCVFGGAVTLIWLCRKVCNDVCCDNIENKHIHYTHIHTPAKNIFRRLFGRWVFGFVPDVAAICAAAPARSFGGSVVRSSCVACISKIDIDFSKSRRGRIRTVIIVYSVLKIDYYGPRFKV